VVTRDELLEQRAKMAQCVISVVSMAYLDGKHVRL